MKTSRASLLINKPFQIRFIFYSIFLVVLVAVIVAGSNLYFFQGLLDEAAKVGVGNADPFYQYLLDTRQRLVVASVVASLLIGVVIIIMSLLLSHRVAGPIYHLVTYLQKKRDGEIQGPLQFRDKDFFPELASSLNQYIESQGRK